MFNFGRRLAQSPDPQFFSNIDINLLGAIGIFRIVSKIGQIGLPRTIDLSVFLSIFDSIPKAPAWARYTTAKEILRPSSYCFSPCYAYKYLRAMRVFIKCYNPSCYVIPPSLGRCLPREVVKGGGMATYQGVLFDRSCRPSPSFRRCPLLPKFLLPTNAPIPWEFVRGWLGRCQGELTGQVRHSSKLSGSIPDQSCQVTNSRWTFSTIFPHMIDLSFL